MSMPVSHRASTIATRFCLPRQRSWKSCSMFKMLRHVWSQGPGNMNVRGLSRLMHDDLHWLVIPQRVQNKLIDSPYRFLRHRAPRYLVDVCQSPKFLIASICDLPEVINCQFLEFAVAPVGPVHFCCHTNSLEFTA